MYESKNFGKLNSSLHDVELYQTFCIDMARLLYDLQRNGTWLTGVTPAKGNQFDPITSASAIIS